MRTKDGTLSGSSRRTFLSMSVGTIAAAPLLSAASARAADRQTASPATKIPQKIIDVHHHPAPKTYVDLGYAGAIAAKWSVEQSLEAMDKGGVATALLSIPVPVAVWANNPKDKILGLVRGWNDYMARLSHDHPKRFGVFAALPLPYPDESLAEIAYVFDSLRVAGVGIMTNTGNKWLGDPLFMPILEELNRRKAVVFVHPITADCCQGLMANISDPTVEVPTDTTRAITQLLFSGMAAKYHDIKFIFCHAGGTMPFTIERLLIAPKFNPKLAAMVPNGVLPELQRFYYDVALSANPYAMSSLKQLVPASQIVFGTDFPFATPVGTMKGLMDSDFFNDNELEAVGRGNMQRLIPNI